MEQAEANVDGAIPVKEEYPVDGTVLTSGQEDDRLVIGYMLLAEYVIGMLLIGTVLTNGQEVEKLVDGTLLTSGYEVVILVDGR